MSTLLQLRAAIIERIQTALPKPWNVAGHQGRFGASDLRQFLTTAPAVRVAILGMTDPKSTDADAVTWQVKVGVFVVARDQGAKLAREQIAAAAVEIICMMCFGERFGLGTSGVHAASAATAQVMFNEDSLTQGVTLWGIDWSQPITLARPEGEVAPLSELWLGIAPDIGAAHVDQYVGPYPNGAGGGDD